MISIARCWTGRVWLNVRRGWFAIGWAPGLTLRVSLRHKLYEFPRGRA